MDAGAGPSAAGALSSATRARALHAMAADELDVLVVGGGVVGAGCALDAATRGLSVGLVEADDWASGTSSRTSKLIHGGLRYLEMLDFGLVREALRERGLLLQRLAPHLVRPVPFLYPLRHRGWERVYAGTGVLLYDLMAGAGVGARGVPRHRHVTRRGALRACPSLSRGALVGGIRYYDAQVDDARYTVFLVRTAAANGAHVVSHARVVGFLREGDRVTGARIRDEDGGRHEVRARRIINATGVWTDETQALAGERGQIRVRASKGVHLVVPRERVRSSTGLIVRTATSVLLVIPWGRHWIIGTTDTDWRLGKTRPTASGQDIDYLLAEVNKVLVTPLTHDDVEGVYAGLRPLLAGGSELTSRLSREHTVSQPAPGMVVVSGGKFSTYRVMARDAVDAAAAGMDTIVPASCTDRVPLLGADGYTATHNRRRRMAAVSGLHVAWIEHLLGRYGTQVRELLDLIRDDPDLGKPLDGADGYLRAEVAYAVTHEGARHLDDVLARRTHVFMESFDSGLAAARPAAEIMAKAMHWTGARLDDEVERYRRWVEAERAAQREPDDEAVITSAGHP
jgi:glycerol-3-phosphate dehydrogenase